MNKDNIDIKSLTKEEQKELIKTYAEGSKTLELALRTLWNKKLYTTACCKGHLLGEKHFYFTSMYSYIAFEKGIDVFKYLSDDLINNPYIVLTSDSNQAIFFYGENKDSLMLMFITDIMKKKEVNSRFLEGKVNKLLDPITKEQVKHDYYLKSGFTEKEYQEIRETEDDILILRMKSQYNNIDENESEELFDKCIKIKNDVYQRKLKKNRGR